jgi:biopolymer transport protein TolR
MLYSRWNPPKLFCQIDVTAFTSIMVILISAVLFAEVGADPNHHRSGVDLPRINYPIEMWDARREDAILVSIARDGRVYFGYEQVTPGQLEEKIKGRLRLGAQRKLYIKADLRAWYGSVRPVLEAGRSAGLLRVGILVDQRRRPFP